MAPYQPRNHSSTPQNTSITQHSSPFANPVPNLLSPSFFIRCVPSPTVTGQACKITATQASRMKYNAMRRENR